jgi:hypothetical protein
MSYRQKETFRYDLKESDKDLARVVKWLDEKKGIEHRMVNEETCDIRAEDGTTYEHKADRQAHHTKNVAFEVYDRNHTKKWLFECEADYMIVTSREHIRVYRWKGGMKEYVIEHMDGKYKKYTKFGGDDDVVELRCIPEWRLRRFLVVEEPWDNSKS